MSHDETVGGIGAYFLAIAVIANETGAPFLALGALVAMPLVAVLALRYHQGKTKRR